MIDRAGRAYEATGRKQRLFGSVDYAAATWDKARRVIVKAEHGALGANPRFVVTNLPQTDRHLYDRLYCARGDMENRKKTSNWISSPAGRPVIGSGPISSGSCRRAWPMR